MRDLRRSTVPVGPTTLAGWGSAALAFVLAAITYLTGGHTAEQTTAVELAAAGLLSGLVTQVGRYLQAHKQITVDLEAASRAVGLTPAQVEALIEQKLPQLLPEILANIGKAVAGVATRESSVGLAGQDPAAKQPGA